MWHLLDICKFHQLTNGGNKLTEAFPSDLVVVPKNMVRHSRSSGLRGTETKLTDTAGERVLNKKLNWSWRTDEPLNEYWQVQKIENEHSTTARLTQRLEGRRLKGYLVDSRQQRTNVKWLVNG